jgi:hypothetical protein
MKLLVTWNSMPVCGYVGSTDKRERRATFRISLLICHGSVCNKSALFLKLGVVIFKNVLTRRKATFEAKCVSRKLTVFDWCLPF